MNALPSTPPPHTIAKDALAPLYPYERDRLRRVIDMFGGRDTARAIGISQQTLWRAAAGANLQRGTRLQLRLSIERFDQRMRSLVRPQRPNLHVVPTKGGEE